MANNSYQKALDEAEAALKRQFAQWEAIDKKILSTSANARKSFNESFNGSTPKDVEARVNKNAKAVTYLNETLKQQKKLEDDLIRSLAKKEAATKSIARDITKQKFETQQLNKINKEEAILTSRLSSFYQKQNVILNKLTRRKQDLILKQKLGVKLTKKEGSELTKLIGKQNALKNAFKQTNEANGRYTDSVGKYGNALKGLKGVLTGLVGAFGVIEGIRMTWNFTKEAIQMAREVQGVEFAFNELGERGVTAFNNIKKSTRGLLSDAEIKKSINEFEQFNLSLEQTDTLFEFLAVSAAQTGKSVDTLKQSLVEGLSKESKLRIDNLGISSAELNAELEKTPKFIDAVANIAKTKIAKAGDILDKSANAGERMKASFENMQIAFGKLFTGSNKGALSILIKELDKLTVGIKIVKDGFVTLKEGIDSFINRIPILKNIVTVISKGFSSAISPIQLFGIALKRIGAGLSGLSAAFGSIKIEVKEFVQSIAALSEIELNILKPIASAKSAKKALGIIKQTFTEGAGDVADAYNKAFDDAMAKKTKDNLVSPTNSKNKEVEKSVSSINKALEGSIRHYEQLLSTQKATRDETALTKEEWDKQTKSITETELKLNRLKDSFKGITPVLSSLKSVGIDFSIVGEDIHEQLKTVEDALKNLPWEESLQIASEFFGEIGNLAATLFDGNIQRIDDEIAANDLKYATLLDNEDLSNNQRNALEAEQERKRLEFEKKKREEQRKQAVIQKAFSAAQIITNTAVAVSKTLAETGVFGIPLTAIVAALGAVQLATVLATPIPQFKDGHLSGTHEGAALINDANSTNYREIIERKTGTLEMYSGRNEVISMAKGDKVHKAGTYNGQSIANNMIAMSMQDQSDKITQAQILQLTVGDEFRKALEGAKFPQPKIINKVPPFDYGKMAKAMMYENRANV